MPYIVEKDYVCGTFLTTNAAIGDTTLTVRDTSNFALGVATIYDDAGGIDPASGLRVNTETITISAIPSATSLTLLAALTGAYTGELSGNLYQAVLAVPERVEFEIPIKTQWCKIAQIKIVQHTPGPMKVSFEVWEETPIYEGNRLELHKNVIRRNIVLTGPQGGWYGESLVNNLILYKDREARNEEGQWFLHCALVNEDGSTASDYHVLLKIVEIGESV